MKTFRRVLDIILGTTGSTFLFYASYQGISEMVNEGPGWYDPSDYLFTILLILVLSTIGCGLVKLALYPFVLWRAEKMTSIAILALTHTNEEGMANQAALEDGLYQAISLFTTEQSEQYYANLKEVK